MHIDRVISLVYWKHIFIRRFHWSIVSLQVGTGSVVETNEEAGLEECRTTVYYNLNCFLGKILGNCQWLILTFQEGRN